MGPDAAHTQELRNAAQHTVGGRDHAIIEWAGRTASSMRFRKAAQSGLEPIRFGKKMTLVFSVTTAIT